jgi:hypothetical protein
MVTRLFRPWPSMVYSRWARLCPEIQTHQTHKLLCFQHLFWWIKMLRLIHITNCNHNKWIGSVVEPELQPVPASICGSRSHFAMRSRLWWDGRPLRLTRTAFEIFACYRKYFGIIQSRSRVIFSPSKVGISATYCTSDIALQYCY